VAAYSKVTVDKFIMRKIVVYITTSADVYIASGAKALDIRPPFGTARSRALTLK
jgi:hypothetical protein